MQDLFFSFVGTLFAQLGSYYIIRGIETKKKALDKLS